MKEPRHTRADHKPDGSTHDHKTPLERIDHILPRCPGGPDGECKGHLILLGHNVEDRGFALGCAFCGAIYTCLDSETKPTVIPVRYSTVRRDS